MKKMETEKIRENGTGFASKLGFVLATAGSAVGLGNLWRFPYLAAKYGGGVFLLIYLILAVTFGFAMMITEASIGRRTGKSVIGAYQVVNESFGGMGTFAALIPVFIMPYYCVIGGWVLKYMCVFATGHGLDAAVDDYKGGAPLFSHFIGQAKEPAIFFVIFVLVNLVVILFGVQKGIENVSKIMMPLLVVLILGIGIYTMTLKGAGAGFKYYILPDFTGVTVSKLLKTIAAAAGQLFYSLSLAMGIMITYGSYMRKEDSMESCVRQIEVFDTAIAFLAGMIIVPAVFIFSNGDAAAMNAGPGLMFLTLPKVFATIPGGQILGTVFFVLVALAAMTSSMSLMETVVAVVMEKFKINRIKAALYVFIFTVVVGLLSVFGYSIWAEFTLFGMQILDFFDFTTNNIMMPILSVLTCILIGYVAKTAYVEEEVERNGEDFKARGMYRVMIKYICPVVMIIILITPFVTKL